MNHHDQKKQFNQLVSGENYQEAMLLCEALFQSGDITRADAYKMRAYVFSHQGLHDEALRERIAALDFAEGDSRDYYQIGFSSLSLGRFVEASKWFEESVAAGKREGNDWFESASSLLISFSKLQTGDYDAARAWLEKTVAIDRDCSMPVPGYGLVAASEIMKKLDSQ